jgi:hypothetical protein
MSKILDIKTSKKPYKIRLFYLAGVAINENGNIIYNYPEQHYDNGVRKSQNTNFNYKKTVRMFKNARNEAIKKRLLAKDNTPSYFLECLLYNVPDNCFTGNEYDIFKTVTQWLIDNTHKFNSFKCQNEIHDLFGYAGYSSPFYYKWEVSRAIEFVNAIKELWNNWG